MKWLSRVFFGEVVLEKEGEETLYKLTFGQTDAIEWARSS